MCRKRGGKYTLPLVASLRTRRNGQRRYAVGSTVGGHTVERGVFALRAFLLRTPRKTHLLYLYTVVRGGAHGGRHLSIPLCQ